MRQFVRSIDVPYFSDQIVLRQAQIEKLYAGLQDLSKERRKRLDETLELYALHREIDDLLQWIADKEVCFCLQNLCSL